MYKRQIVSLYRCIVVLLYRCIAVSLYRFHVFVVRVCLSPSGDKIPRKTQMRIHEGHFLKIALNLDLTLPDDGECPALLISCGIIDLGAFCVELWPFFVSERISVPMSYITCLDVCATNQNTADT